MGLSIKHRRLRARGWSKRHISLLGNRVFLRSPGARASLTTALTGTNNDFVVRANYPGTEYNSLRVRIVVSGNNTPLSVVKSGNDITVNSATNGSAVATSTARQVVDALNADREVAKVAAAEVAPANDGTGAVVALAYTNLTGGAS
jgi:hypothetical protein